MGCLDAKIGEPLQLVRPATQHLDSYVNALKRGWSADNLRGAVAAQEELARISEDPSAFLAVMEDREAKGPPVIRRIKCFPDSWTPAVALGWRVLWLNRPALATWHSRTSAALPRPYWVRRCALEAGKRLRHRSTASHVV